MVVNIGNATLYHGDCVEIMKGLDKVSHVICDPPYEDDMHKSKEGSRGIRTDGRENLKPLNFESVTKIRPIVMPIMADICEGWFLAFCTPEGVAAWRDEIESCKIKYKRACVWVKPDAAPQFNGQGPAMGAENFVTAWCGKGVSKWNGGGKRGVWTCNTNQPDRDGTHPAEKPLPLMMQLINDFTNAGDTILDPFMGSCTTGLACLKLGRKFIGIEKDNDYFDLSVRRIQAMPGSGYVSKEPPPFEFKEMV